MRDTEDRVTYPRNYRYSDTDETAAEIAYQCCAHGRIGQPLRAALVDGDATWVSECFAAARRIADGGEW